MMPAGRGLRHGRRPPAGRHQTGCGRIPTVANASAGMAEAPASCRRAGDRWSNTGGRARSDDGKSRADRIFQPSNDKVHRNPSPVDSARFSRVRWPRCRIPWAQRPRSPSPRDQRRACSTAAQPLPLRGARELRGDAAPIRGRLDTHGIRRYSSRSDHRPEEAGICKTELRATRRERTGRPHRRSTASRRSTGSICRNGGDPCAFRAARVAPTVTAFVR